MVNKWKTLGFLVFFFYFSSLIMSSAADNKDFEFAKDIENFFSENLAIASKYIKQAFGSVKTVAKIFNIIMVFVIIGSILFCIVTPIIYIISTLISSITKCVRKCKAKDNQELYEKLNERIALIEEKNGLKGQMMDKNQNDPAASQVSVNTNKGGKDAEKSVAAGTSGAGTEGGGTSAAKSAVKTVDGKESAQQKS